MGGQTPVMESENPVSLWKGTREELSVHPLSLGHALTNAVQAVFSKYDNQMNEHCETMSFCDQGSGVPDHTENASMSSASSDVARNTRAHARLVHFENSDSEESMSVGADHLDSGPESGEDEDGHTRYWKVKWTPERDTGPPEKSHGNRRTKSSQQRCLRCEAYDAHCKSAAENYKRTLTNYTKTVSELMIGFKKVLERYPELRVDSSDEHLHYMVQSALGRNNLVQEMVRLSAKRQARDTITPGSQELACETDRSVITMQEALNTCYSDGEALRMCLKRYTDLYVRYIQVWREMCSKVSGDLTVMEFVTMTNDRPGVSHGEPWSEAKGYLARITDKVGSITPRTVSEACARALESIRMHLSYAPTDFTKRKMFIQACVEEVRDHLDSNAREWSWDSHMNDVYLDVRCDLTILDTLVGLGEISVKTLLQERSMLTSQLRKFIRNQGALELQVQQLGSRLTKSLRLHPEMY